MITLSEIPHTVHETLVEQFGQDRGAKPIGYVKTQSLRRVVEHLGPDNIMAVKAKRTQKDVTESEKYATKVPDTVIAERQVKEKVAVRYDKDSQATRLNWDEVDRFLTETEIRDLPVSKLVAKFENRAIMEQIVEILNEAIGLDTEYNGYFDGPVYVTMKAGKPQQEDVREKIHNFHQDGWLAQMGWNVRPLYLSAIHSHNARIDRDLRPPTDIESDLRMADIESRAVNHAPDDSREYGVINSRLVVDAWRDEFGPSFTDYRTARWTEEGSWK